MRGIIAFLFCLSASLARAEGYDPYVLGNSSYDTHTFRDTRGLSRRSPSIDPEKRSLVLIVAGASNRANDTGSLYLPPHGDNIDTLNVFDGALYNIVGPLPGATFEPSLGPGNIAAYLAELLVSSGKFDRVILVSLAIGGTSATDWISGDFANRVSIALARLKDLSITPDTPGVTFAMEWGQGEIESFLHIPPAYYARQLNTIIRNARRAGFSGRTFVAVETWIFGKVWPPIQAAQRSVVNRKTVFQSCNCDILGRAYRQDKAGHFNRRGAAAAAKLIHQAMRASGPPF
jgi:hypothetical protein